MKTLWSILLICGLSGQDYWIDDGTWRGWSIRLDTTEWVEYDTTYRIGNKIYNSEWVNEIILISLILYEQYEVECLADTIKAIKFEDNYIIDFEGGILKEMVTERQLEDRGYRYKYRWVINNSLPLELEYIFIKEQTLPGFMKWLKEKQ